MTIGEILAKAGIDTLLGMGTVFLMLMFISFVIYLFRFVNGEKKPEIQAETEAAALETPEPQGREDQLAAVIAAAVAASLREDKETEKEIDPDEYIVRSIKRRR